LLLFLKQSYVCTDIYLLFHNVHSNPNTFGPMPAFGRTRRMNMKSTMNLLRVDSSGRYEGSSTRALTDALIEALQARNSRIGVSVRDLARGMPHVDESWIQANFTYADDRSDQQKDRLLYSDELVAEVQDADIIVIGVPIYNFGIPAALKAWVDMVARARLTFRYTENGPAGLLTGKRVYLVVASGGVAVDSAADFATPYMRQALRFLGITDINVVRAEQQNSHGEESLDFAHAQIADLAHGDDSRAA
jgi:FMN-dependent NADH-azoreductase